MTRLPVVLAALVTAVLLAGCGGQPEADGPEESASPSTSSSASASPSPRPTPSASASPTPPPLPPATDDEAGRRAFVTWFADAFGYAFATNDASPITAVASTDSATRCATCAAFARFLAERDEAGKVLVPSTYDVKEIYLTGKAPGMVVYTLVTDRPAFNDVRRSGKIVKRVPRDPNYLISVSIRWDGKGYELVDWIAGEGAGDEQGG